MTAAPGGRRDPSQRGPPGLATLWVVRSRLSAATDFLYTPTGRRLVWTILVEAVIGLGILGAGMVLSRRMETHERGVTAALLLWPQLIASIGVLGLDLSATHFSADPRHRRDATATALATALPLGLASAVVYAGLIPVIFAGDQLGLFPLVVAVVSPVNIALMIAQGALQGRLDFRAFNLARGFMAPLYAVLLGLFAAAHQLTPKTAAASYLLATAWTLGLTAWLLWRTGGIGRIARDLRRTLVRYGVVAHWGRLSAQHIGVDQVIVGISLSKDDLGVFATAVILLGAPRLLTTGAGLVLFPTASSQHHQGRPPLLRSPMAASLALNALVAVVLAAAAGPLVHHLFSAKYADAVTVLRIMLIGEVVRAGSQMLGEVLRGSGHHGLPGIAQAFDWVAFIALVSAGSAIGGLHGAAAGVVATNFLTAALTVGLAVRAGALHHILGLREEPHLRHRRRKVRP